MLVHNIEWLLELYQAEQILTMELKHIMNKLENEFTAICKKTLRHYLVILMYQGETLTSDMFQQSTQLSLRLDKALKIYVFKLVFSLF